MQLFNETKSGRRKDLPYHKKYEIIFCRECHCTYPGFLEKIGITTLRLKLCLIMLCRCRILKFYATSFQFIWSCYF